MLSSSNYISSWISKFYIPITGWAAAGFDDLKLSKGTAVESFTAVFVFSVSTYMICFRG